MYKIKLDVFEGPLDLLLYLVKKDHLNICDIPIIKVTEQYLAYLELMKMLDLNIAGEFLVMAATLINIKSKMLLPVEKTAEEEEIDPRAELIQKLLEYQRFKEVAQQLRDKEEKRQDIFVRPKDKELEAQPPELYFEASVFDLLSAFSKVLKDIPKDIFYQVIKDETTVEDKIHEILHYLLESDNLSVFDLFRKAKSKVEIAAYFLATLELIRLKEIVIVQKCAFADISIMLNKASIAPVVAKDERETNS